MKNLIVSLLLTSSIASAARLDDVKILDVLPGADNVELKLQTKDGSNNAFFFVDISKNDPEAFEKLIYVVNKMKLKDKFKLDLDIISFSAFPSGSYYKSESVAFFGPDRQPNGLKMKKK